MASRTAISRERAEARLSIRFVTLAQAISSTTAARADITSTSMLSIGRLWICARA